MDRNKAISIIRQCLTEAIRVTGSRAFSLSQQRVPVVTGFLRSTGSGKDIDNGFVLNYGAEYSEYPERGVKPGIRNVRAYRRKDGAIVKAHSYFSRGQRAQHYIESSLKEAFTQDFATNFDGRIRSAGIKVIKV